MASINLAGVLRNPDTTLASGGEIRLIHRSNTGEVISGFRETLKVNNDGTYDINIQYGNVFIQTRDNGVNEWTNHGTLTINQDTVATTLPELLNAAVPPTDSQLLEFQSLLADAVNAANDAQLAQSETEALFDNFDSSVADANSRVLTPKPDVYIPFNDSLKIVRGYGTHDQIDVSAAQDGSVMVDLPSKSVDFSRASGRTVINKSGELVTLGTDEPAISSDGLEIYGQYTSIGTYSEDFSRWPGVLTANAISQSSPVGLDKEWLIESDGTSTTPVSIRRKSTSFNADIDSYIIQALVKNVDGSPAYFGCANGVLNNAGCNVSGYFDFTTETITLTSTAPHAAAFSGYQYIGGGYYLVWLGATNCVGVLSGAQNVDIGVYSADAGSSCIFAYCMQVENKSVPMPYVKTEAVPVTVSPDVASIPMRNNMPAAGKPFTIMLDLPDYPSESGTPWRVNVSPTPKKLYLSRGAPNAYYFFLAESPFIGTGNLGSTVDAPHRVVARFDGANIAIFINGDKKNERAATPPFEWDLDDTIKFYSNHDSAIKNFEIYHRALTDDEIKAKGAAK